MEVESRCCIGDGSPALHRAAVESAAGYCCCCCSAAVVVNRGIWRFARPMQAARCCCTPPQRVRSQARTRRVRGLWPLPVPVAACLPACLPVVRSAGRSATFRVCSHRGVAASSLIAAGPFVSPPTYRRFRERTCETRVSHIECVAGGLLLSSISSSSTSSVVARKSRGD